MERAWLNAQPGKIVKITVAICPKPSYVQFMKQKTVTLATAMKDLGIGRSTIYRWMRATYIESVIIAGKLYVVCDETYKELKRLRS